MCVNSRFCCLIYNFSQKRHKLETMSPSISHTIFQFLKFHCHTKQDRRWSYRQSANLHIQYILSSMPIDNFACQFFSWWMSHFWRVKCLWLSATVTYPKWGWVVQMINLFQGLTVSILVGRLSVVSPTLLSGLVWKIVDGVWKSVLNYNRPCQATIWGFGNLD